MAYTNDRPSLLPLELKQLVTTNNNKLAQFQFKPFVVNLGTILAYSDWWVSVFNRAFPRQPDNYLSKLISGN